MAAGIVFTVLLVAIYVPVAALHDKWLNKLTEEQVKTEPMLKVDEWLARSGLNASPVSVGTALALPILAFVFTTLIKSTLG